MTAALGIALASAAAVAISAAPAGAAPSRAQFHTVDTYSYAGAQYQCGDVLLTANGGTYTETIDGAQDHGVVRVTVVREYVDLTLLGSDGRTYTARAFAHEHATLIPPDFDNPVAAHEIAETRFFIDGRTVGWAQYRLVIEHGSRTDTNAGPCTALD